MGGIHQATKTLPLTWTVTAYRGLTCSLFLVGSALEFLSLSFGMAASLDIQSFGVMKTDQVKCYLVVAWSSPPDLMSMSKSLESE